MTRKAKTNITATLTLLVVSVLFCQTADAQLQVEIKGTVYDRSEVNELEGVSVMSSSGTWATSDSVGHYRIWLMPGDSIYFSYQGKKSPKFAVKKIENPLRYDISLDVEIKNLTQIYVSPNSYHLDSLENRKEYEDIFNYEKPGVLEGMKSRGRGFGFGLDMDQIFADPHLHKSRESVQRYFEEDERQRYIDHRFSRILVRKLTGLTAPALDTFMHEYRPSYEFCKSFVTDWEFDQYIQDMGKSFAEAWKQEQERKKGMTQFAISDSAVTVPDSLDAPPGQR